MLRFSWDKASLPFVCDTYTHSVWKLMESSVKYYCRTPAVVVCIFPTFPFFSIRRPEKLEGYVNNFQWNSSFCTTTSGRVAFLPPMARKGDLICILYGSEVPYLLRPRMDGNYVVVGECYANGIMHGEALSADISPERYFRITWVWIYKGTVGAASNIFEEN